MDKQSIIFEDAKHKVVMFSFENEDVGDNNLSVNQFLIIHNNKGILIDPGSSATHYDLMEAITEHIEVENIEYVFFSHQDPDVAGSISELSFSTGAQFIISKLWTRFMTHYGFFAMDRIIELPDEGLSLEFESTQIVFVPAHFMHSPGNFAVYDPYSKILFSGDIGAAILPRDIEYKIVEDFESHKTFLQGFHQRYMPSSYFCKKFVKNARSYDIDYIIPQHGAIFHNRDVNKFLDWLDNLECADTML